MLAALLCPGSRGTVPQGVLAASGQRNPTQKSVSPGFRQSSAQALRAETKFKKRDKRRASKGLVSESCEKQGRSRAAAPSGVRIDTDFSSLQLWAPNPSPAGCCRCHTPLYT
ncbi:hypothetical protein E2C01_055224 [Portunus trituberculatus]|uniref:Uncharacterized protein n=1 Tax=Portunus trituberculatus TaxID=210409 RepID=A0A5B7GLX1_PORTR|nr:hypothetical protein [Portunus trituberculatus]